MARQPRKLILSADYAGSGAFSAVGALQPSFALNAAIERFCLHRGDPKKGPVLIHAVASKIVGRCALENAEAERALFECYAARLAAEWVVAIPALGALRTLYLVERLEGSELEGLFDLVLRVAGKPSFCELQTEDAGTG
jgi:hypothetical protein